MDRWQAKSQMHASPMRWTKPRRRPWARRKHTVAKMALLQTLFFPAPGTFPDARRCACRSCKSAAIYVSAPHPTSEVVPAGVVPYCGATSRTERSAHLLGARRPIAPSADAHVRGDRCQPNPPAPRSALSPLSPSRACANEVSAELSIPQQNNLKRTSLRPGSATSETSTIPELAVREHSNDQALTLPRGCGVHRGMLSAQEIAMHNKLSSPLAFAVCDGPSEHNALSTRRLRCGRLRTHLI